MYADLDGATNGVSTNQLGVLWAWSASDPRIDYPSFASVTDLVLVGSTTPTNNLLRLTATIVNAPGGAWYRYRYPVAAGFEAFFEFRIDYHGGSGLAFVIQNFANTALGGGGPAMGYTFADCLAVEFDTYQSGASDYTNGNHVSVQTRGTTANNNSHAYSLGAASAPRNMSDNKSHFARISYQPGTLRVYLDDFSAPLVTASVDLQALLALTEGSAWLGFTAANGTLTSVQDTLDWTVSRTVPAGNDTNGNGLPDWWENWRYLGPTNGVALADGDRDGQSNLSEYLAGTDPANRDSCFHITGLSLVGTNQLRLSWSAVGAHKYQVQCLTNLLDGSGSNLGPVIVMPAGGESTTNCQLPCLTVPPCYFRLRLAP